LYDAVALLSADEAIPKLVQESTARDFVADAFAHCKFIGYAKSAIPLFDKAGITDSLDDGCFALSSPKDVGGFIEALGQLRYWARESEVKMQKVEAI
jgi:catalase